MSLVIGYRDYADGSVWMASDGLATFGCAQVEVVKVRRYDNGSVLVGTTGLHRLNNIILDLYAPTMGSPHGEHPYDFALRFAQDLRLRCKEAGVLTPNKEGQEDMGGRVLLGYAGHLFGVSSDFAVIEHSPWWAIGCGCEWAEGALEDWVAKARADIEPLPGEALQKVVAGTFAVAPAVLARAQEISRRIAGASKP